LENNTSNAVLIYASFAKDGAIAPYIQQVLLGIKPYIQHIIFVTNKRNLLPAAQLFIAQNNIQLLQVSNKGYDFGKIYKALQLESITSYNRLLFMNDSLMQVGSNSALFNWINNSANDVVGLLNSNERAPHLQSYFLVINKNAIQATLQYFKKHKRYYLKRKVIKVYELGLSTYWQQQGFILDSFININTIENNYPHNPSYFLLEQLMHRQIPYIKRHILMNSFGQQEKADLLKQNFNLSSSYWQTLINKYYSNNK
jgi:lipopolysaccharide biosynthesis protein